MSPQNWPEFSTELKKNDLNEQKLKDLVDSKEERTKLVEELKSGKLLDALKDNKTTINTFCEKIFAWKNKEDVTKKWSSEAAILYLYTALNAKELWIKLQSINDPSLQEIEQTYDKLISKKTPETKDTKLEVKDIKDINLVEIQNIVLANGKNWSEAPTHQELVDAINAIQWAHKAKIIGFMKEIGTYATTKDKINTEKTTIALQKYLIDDCKCTIYGWADGKIWRYTYNTIVNLSSTEKKDTEGKIVYKRVVPEKKAEVVKGENKDGAKVQNNKTTTPATTPTNNEGKIPFKMKEETAVTIPTTPIDVTKIVPQYTTSTEQKVSVPYKIDETKNPQQTTTPTDAPTTFANGSAIPNTKVWETIKQHKSKTTTEAKKIDTKKEPAPIEDKIKRAPDIIQPSKDKPAVNKEIITPGNKLELTPNNDIYASRKEPKKETPIQETPKEKPNDVVNKTNEIVDKSAEIKAEVKTNLENFWEIKNFMDDNPKLVKTINDITNNITDYESADTDNPIKKETAKEAARTWIDELKTIDISGIKNQQIIALINSIKNYNFNPKEQDPPQSITSLWHIVNNYFKVIHNNNRLFLTKDKTTVRDNQGKLIDRWESDSAFIQVMWGTSKPHLQELSYGEFFSRNMKFEELRAIKNPEFEIIVNKLSDRPAGHPQGILHIIVTEKK